jgi:hypothetical protein
MHRGEGTPRARFRGISGAVCFGILVSGVAIFAAAGSAASKATPVNTSPPTITGVPQEGRTLTGNRGAWTNNPTSYAYQWSRCARSGGSCSPIAGANGFRYTLKSVDVGSTLRFYVKATNADGTTSANSAHTAVVTVVTPARPVNTSPPTISGTPEVGQTLTGNGGTWANNPTSYAYAWFRCAANGSSCVGVGDAGLQHKLKSSDIGHTYRFRVIATNAGGKTGATSAPTSVVVATRPPPPPSRGNGCPAGSGNPDQVTAISPPARLLVDALQSDPTVATSGTQTLVVRFHVTSTCGGPVQGALVYATATPYNQFSIPPETSTAADGWATLTFQRLSGFPVSSHQRLIALFVRARKAGENLLGGISTRRLVSVRVNLRG